MAITPELRRGYKRLGLSFAMAVSLGSLSVYGIASAEAAKPKTIITKAIGSTPVSQSAEMDASATYKKFVPAPTTTEAPTTTSTPPTTAAHPPVTTVAAPQVATNGSLEAEMAAAGIPAADYHYAEFIDGHESGDCATAVEGHPGICNPYNGYVPATGGYGECQSTPGSKMAAFGADWAYNPITQLKWCNWYANSRYGGWYNSYIHWMHNRNW